MIEYTSNWNVAEENILLIRRVLASINIQEPELTAMLDAYMNSVSERILGPREPRELTDIEKNLGIDVAEMAKGAAQRFVASLAKELKTSGEQVRWLLAGNDSCSACYSKNHIAGPGGVCQPEEKI